MVCVNHLLVTINSSFNFLIFLMSAKRKRRGKEKSNNFLIIFLKTRILKVLNQFFMHTSMPILTHKHGIILCLQSKPLNLNNILGIKCTFSFGKGS